tara:strand:- start:403 stop:969 length:567 start_codon:yes stop_codon:yes gene_type:complete
MSWLLFGLIKIIHRMSLLLAIEMSVACSLSYQAGLYLGQLYQPKTAAISALWCMISTILVMQSTWARSLEFGFARMIGSGLGSVMGAACFYIFGINTAAYWLGIFLLVVGCCYFDREQYLRLALLTMTVVYIVGIIDSDQLIIGTSISRLIESVVGILVTLVVRFSTINIHRTLDDLVEASESFDHKK